MLGLAVNSQVFARQLAGVGSYFFTLAPTKERRTPRERVNHHHGVCSVLRGEVRGYVVVARRLGHEDVRRVLGGVVALHDSW